MSDQDPKLVIRLEFQGEEVYRIELPPSTAKVDFVFPDPCEVYDGIKICLPVVSEISFRERLNDMEAA